MIRNRLRVPFANSGVATPDRESSPLLSHELHASLNTGGALTILSEHVPDWAQPLLGGGKSFTIEEVLHPEDVLTWRREIGFARHHPGQRLQLDCRLKGAGLTGEKEEKTGRKDAWMWCRVDIQAELLARRGEEKQVYLCFLQIGELVQWRERCVRAEHEAKMAEQSRATFLAQMNHELRTPLNAVIGFAGMMRGELLGPLESPSYREYAGYIEQSGLELLQKVNDILAYSRLEFGKEVLEESEESLETWLGRICGHWAEGLDPAESIRLSCSHLVPHCLLRADTGRFEQALHSLIAGMVQGLERGGEIVFRTHLTPTGGLVLGIDCRGLPQDVLQDVMASISKGDALPLTKRGNIALGILMLRKVMALHEGGVSLNNATGHNLSLSLYLPPERVRQASSSLYLAV